MKNTTALAFLSLTLFCVPAAYADTFGSGANTFDIEFVSIGNQGNAADTDDGDGVLPGIQEFGSVAYEYRIGNYEISEQMIDKANAQSALDGNPLGITKDTRGPIKPATSLSWFETAKFVNWLNTNSGSTAAYNLTAAATFNYGSPAMPATARTILIAIASPGIFCRASMSGTQGLSLFHTAQAVGGVSDADAARQFLPIPDVARCRRQSRLPHRIPQCE